MVQEQVAILCAQLEYWTGSATRATKILQSTLFKTPILAIEADELTAVIANDLSHFERADEHFRRALQSSEHLIELRIARLHKGRAWMHLRQRQLELAEQELDQAHFELENMRGNLAMDRGNFSQALQHYHVALQLAESQRADERIARTCNNLAGIALFQGNFVSAIAFLERSLFHYRQTGKLADWACAHITLAVAHNQSGNHQAALQALTLAENELREIGNITSWQAGLIAQGRAEAWLGLNHLDWAEEQARQAMASEEISLLPDAYRVYGEIRCKRGDYANAEGWLKQSLALAEENQDRYLAAYAWRALLQLYLAQCDLANAKLARTQTIELFEALNLGNEVMRLKQ